MFKYAIWKAFVGYIILLGVILHCEYSYMPNPLPYQSSVNCTTSKNTTDVPGVYLISACYESICQSNYTDNALLYFQFPKTMECWIVNNLIVFEQPNVIMPISWYINCTIISSVCFCLCSVYMFIWLKIQRQNIKTDNDFGIVLFLCFLISCITFVPHILKMNIVSLDLEDYRRYVIGAMILFYFVNYLICGGIIFCHEEQTRYRPSTNKKYRV